MARRKGPSAPDVLPLGRPPRPGDGRYGRLPVGSIPSAMGAGRDRVNFELTRDPRGVPGPGEPDEAGVLGYPIGGVLEQGFRQDQYRCSPWLTFPGGMRTLVHYQHVSSNHALRGRTKSRLCNPLAASNGRGRHALHDFRGRGGS